MGESNAAGKPEWVDPDDAPELTDAFFETAEYWQGDRFIRQGGARMDGDREVVTIALDKDVLAKLRATGPGWQSRVSALLRDALSSR